MTKLILFILFNLLNILDKFITYIGLQRGFVETNNITNKLIIEYGLKDALILKIILGLAISFVIYNYYDQLPESIKTLIKYLTLIIIGFYAAAIISNIYWLIV